MVRGIILALGIFTQLFAQNTFVPGKVFLQINSKDIHAPAHLTPSSFPSAASSFHINAIEKTFVTQDPRLDGIYSLSVAQGQEMAFCEWAESLDWVAYAEPVPYVYSHYVPDDYDSTALSHLNIIRAVEAWDLEKGDKKVVIAIVDNGVMTDHKDLQANLWINPLEIPGDSLDNDANGFIDDIYGYDVADGDGDPSIPHTAFKHGSHVAGCASAVTDNGLGIASIGYGCSLMAVKVASDKGPSNVYSFDQALKGVDYAIHNGADIINMSFGGTGYSLTGQILMEVGHERGLIFVAAAGNGPGDTNPATGDTTWEYPACFAHVISVSTTDALDKRAAIATVNSQVDVCAPGLQIRSTIPSVSLGSSYSALSGSSMSCAIVSGLLGLMLAHNPCLSPDEAESLLKAGCVNIDGKSPAWAGKLGAGRIDAFASLTLLETLARPSARFVVKDSIACDGLLSLSYRPDSLSACPESWLWRWGNAAVDSSAHPIIRLDSSGLYDFSLVVTNAWGRDSFHMQKYIFVAAAPLLDAGASIYISRGDTAQLMATAPASSFAWQPTEGLWPSAQIANPRVAPDSTTRYWVWATNAAGCSSSDSVTVFVDPRMSLFPSDQKKYNPLHVHWISEENCFYIQMEQFFRGTINVSLYNMEGKKLNNSQYNFFTENAGFFISFNQPPPKGIYLLECSIEGNSWSRKCIIY